MAANETLMHLLGTGLLAGGAVLLAWRVLFLMRAVRVTGEVIEWVDDPPLLPDPDRPFATWRRKIAYRDHTGAMHHVMPWARFNSGPFSGMATGVPIGVYFMPEMPGWPLLDAPCELWLPPVALLAAGGIMLGWGSAV